MDLAPYDYQYESQIISLWNRTLCADSINEVNFRKQILFDENFQKDLCLIALDGARVIGFILGMKRQFPYLDRGLEPERGWISLLFVDPEYQRRGIGRTLVKEVENRLISLGAKRITIAVYSPNYFFPGVDIDAYPSGLDFFQALGYTMGNEAVSMERSLYDHRLSEEFAQRMKVANELGYSFRKFEYKDSMELLEFLGKNFGGGWKQNALTAMRSQVADNTIWVALDKEDRIVGFCMRKMDGNDHRFGPFGVLEELRSHGLGYLLFELMMDDMKKQRLYHLYFLWTSGAGMRFYQKHGVKVYRTYRLFDKKVV